jgi:hypothetical protein
METRNAYGNFAVKLLGKCPLEILRRICKDNTKVMLRQQTVRTEDELR